MQMFGNFLCDGRSAALGTTIAKIILNNCHEAQRCFHSLRAVRQGTTIANKLSRRPSPFLDTN
jgi:hypothetical protein